MTRSDLGRALPLGLAAWTAFASATALGIDHAFWASMPVWVVAQPWRGVTLERALWRLLGTLVGGGAGLALLFLSPAPWVTALGMALLMALGAALVHLWQGVRSYIPLMSAITVAVVVIPAMLAPAGGLDLALDRLACTIIGGLCVAAIVGPCTPAADRQGFRAAGRDLAEQFLATARLLLTPPAGGDAQAVATARDAAVAGTVSRGAALENRARLVAAGSRDGYRRMAALDAILAAGLALLEAATTASRAPRTRDAARALLEAGEPADAPAPGPAPAVLGRLARARHDLAAATADLQSVAPAGRDLRRLLPPHNPALALRGAVLAATASLAGSVMLLLTGSFAAELTAFSMAIFALVLGSMPVPQTMAPKLGTGVLLGAAAGVAYRLGIQPRVGDWGMLVLTILPFIAVGAVARANPRTAPYALDANMCFMLSSQAGAAAAPAPEVLGSGSAMAIGTLAIVGCVMALPRPGAGLIARTEARLTRDLELLSSRPVPLAPQRWSAIWGRRVLTLATALESAGEPLPRRLLVLAGQGHDALERRGPAPGASTGPERGKDEHGPDGRGRA